jgi:hypothetical protein
MQGGGNVIVKGNTSLHLEPPTSQNDKRRPIRQGDQHDEADLQFVASLAADCRPTRILNLKEDYHGALRE